MNHRLLSDAHTQQLNRSFANQAWPYAIKNPNALSRSIPDELKGYAFPITGGNNEQGFSMKQGVLLPYHVCLLADKHSSDGQRLLTLLKCLAHKRTTNTLNFSREDGVGKYVIRREVKSGKENAKPYTKAPEIQRLVTSIRL
ncbi:hypothetical protein ARMSODRAFT_1021766 [Armillaria solidipes]|uniref:Uncharacterized protein n=1 Tax=Armillaria solidipes TaxID=1076256 RepID=A0A2H3BNM2_9AGAR|nr:hypothetical protein ARMSODRAFT_1021766 [Armillaria solidipes]